MLPFALPLLVALSLVGLLVVPPPRIRGEMAVPMLLADRLTLSACKLILGCSFGVLVRTASSSAPLVLIVKVLPATSDPSTRLDSLSK